MALSRKILFILGLTFSCLLLVPLFLPEGMLLRGLAARERALAAAWGQRYARDCPAALLRAAVRSWQESRVRLPLAAGEGETALPEGFCTGVEVCAWDAAPEEARPLLDALRSGPAFIDSTDAGELVLYQPLPDPEGEGAPLLLRFSFASLFTEEGRSALARLRLAVLAVGAVALLMALATLARSLRTHGVGAADPSPSGEPAAATVTEILDLLARAQEQRLEAASALAAGVAHEANQPLNALQLNASGLLMLFREGRAPGPDAVRERLERIVAQAERIGAVITHMRELARQGKSGPPVPTDLRRAVERALELVRRQIESRGIEIRMDIPDSLPPVLAQPLQLEQAAINLLVNAMQALERSPRQEKYIALAARPEAAGVLWTVSDNGPGLGPEASSLFEPFVSGRAEGGGMGVGLHLIRAFVQEWGGRIDAGAAPGGGAEFRLWLWKAPADGGGT